MQNILDLLSDEERAKVKARYQSRMKRRRNTKEDRVSPEIYLIAEFGYYLGYEAIKDVRENKISLEDMFALLEGCRKVWYSRLIESSQGSMVAHSSSLSKDPVEAFKKGMEPYSKQVNIKE
ncbi:MAG: hypothetical protein HXM25_03095 [Haemophilus parainfluenzae]|nr:hypothetical protein [Haemophilus parainfluenzae]DAS15332.1 MAG TPA: putative Zn-dependent protease [Caudoviricetes sp.]